jgi:hypothetical protein
MLNQNLWIVITVNGKTGDELTNQVPQMILQNRVFLGVDDHCPQNVKRFTDDILRSKSFFLFRKDFLILNIILYYYIKMSIITF